MKKLKIGLFGLGTVGSSVVDILKARKSELKKDGYEFILKRVCEKDIKKRHNLSLKRDLFAASPARILNDPEIDVVIELIGGEHPARDIIKGALRNRKSVITANKKIVSEEGPVLAREAKRHGRYFGFRAAITGCHIVMDQLVHGGPINSVVGVFNGTCNYVLTRMKELGEEQTQVIKEAQKLGYAEKNPSEDIDGIDTKYKVRILSMLVFGFKPPGKRMLVEGIEGVALEDIRFADQLGYEIRLLGILNKSRNVMDVRVHPALVPQGTKFAMLRGVQNCIEIDDVLRGVGGAVYEGAGGTPAASAVIQDIIDAADGAPINWPSHGRGEEKLSLIPEGMIRSRYYILFKALNRPGVLAGISSVLARNNINIAKVEQKEEEKKGLVPIVLITDSAIEANIRKALKRISQIDIIKGEPKLIRILDTL
jgi:homoserine dehydrogenase